MTRPTHKLCMKMGDHRLKRQTRRLGTTAQNAIGAVMNPRFVLWARSAGHDPRALLRPGRDEVTRIDGTPWTVFFMAWITERWNEWATELGYRDHRVALTDGHTHDDFDAWLEAKYKGTP